MNTHGGKRKGAGRPKGRDSRHSFAISADALKVLNALPSKSRGNFISVAVVDRYRKGYGGRISVVDHCAEMLGVEAKELGEWLSKVPDT
jgi:hypothetical protein